VVWNADTQATRNLGGFDMIPSKWSDVVTLKIQKTDTEDPGQGVSSPPIARFNFTPQAPLTGTNITFDGTASSDPDGSITRFEWDFDDDGNIEETGPTAIYNYSTKGLKNVSLTVTDSDNNSTTVTKTLFVSDTQANATTPPNATFTVAPTEPGRGETVRFNASGSTDDGNITKYEWDLDGDGTYESRGVSTQTSYPDAGIYRVSLRVTDNKSATDVQTKAVAVGDVQVGDGQPPGRYEWEATRSDPDESDDESQIRLSIQFSESAESVDVRMYRRGQPGDTLFVEDYANTESVVTTQKLVGAQRNETWVVAWNATFQGEQISGQRILGPGDTDLGVPLQQKWLDLIVGLTMTLVAGLMLGVRAEVGAVVLALVGGGFWVIGWLPPAIGGGAVIGAIAIAALVRVATSNEVQTS
jgi:hypothetical protein